MCKNLRLLFLIVTTSMVSFSPIMAMLMPRENTKTMCLDATFFTPPFTLEKKKMRYDVSIDKKVPYYYYLHDAADKKFVLKYPIEHLEYVIHDVLGSTIGASIGININDVRIVLPHEPAISAFDDEPSTIKTLHTRMPGSPVEASGAVSLKDGIVSLARLESLCKHKDLTGIMGLDIFFNNVDRSKRNLFYNEQDGRYYGIDMDQIWPDLYLLPNTDAHDWDDEAKLLEQKNSVVNKSYQFLSTFFSDKTPTSEQSNALIGVNNTLNMLVQKYSPAILYNLLMGLAKDVGYEYCQSKQKFVFAYIERNFNRVQKFQKLLTKLTNNSTST